MDFGAGYFPTHDGIGPGQLGRLVEEHGMESLFFAEHTHIPASRDTPYPSGGELPKRYWHTLDPFVALAAVATTTTSLRIGTGVCLVIERDPIVTAKEVASVDHLSGGRFLFGVGAGWNREEMANHGTDAKVRMSVLRERVEAMRAIWTQEEASYSGEYVKFDRIWSWPKPVQHPHPPVLVGGTGPKVLDRVLAFGDAWFPTFHPQVFDRVGELRARAGRHVEVDVIGVPADPAVLQRLFDTGVRRAAHWLPSGPRPIVERGLERWAAAIAEFNGES
jgi:probable F420-dependent oxidoreductase